MIAVNEVHECAVLFLILNQITYDEFNHTQSFTLFIKLTCGYIYSILCNCFGASLPNPDMECIMKKKQQNNFIKNLVGTETAILPPLQSMDHGNQYTTNWLLVVMYHSCSLNHLLHDNYWLPSKIFLRYMVWEFLHVWNATSKTSPK